MMSNVIFTVYDASCNTYRAKVTTVTPGSATTINLSLGATYVLGTAPIGTYGTDFWVINSTIRATCYGSGSPSLCPGIGVMAITDPTTALNPTCLPTNPQSNCFEIGTGCLCTAGSIINAAISAGGSGQQIIIQ